MRHRRWPLAADLSLVRREDGLLGVCRLGFTVIELAGTGEDTRWLLPKLTGALREMSRLPPLERCPFAPAGLAIAREARLSDRLWMLQTPDGLWLNVRQGVRTRGVLLAGGDRGPWQALMDALSELELEGEKGGGA